MCGLLCYESLLVQGVERFISSPIPLEVREPGSVRLVPVQFALSVVTCHSLNRSMEFFVLLQAQQMILDNSISFDFIK